MSKKILVTGSSGYVANYIMLTMAKKYPTATILGMSRSGLARNPAIMSQYPNIEYIKGNCLHPDTFKEALNDVDACIHTVGQLFPYSHPELSYKAMNRDTVIHMSRELNQTASAVNKKPFIMISSQKPPPFLNEYLTTKQEGESFILGQCPNLTPFILRPGFIVNKEHRAWSAPLKFGVDFAFYLNEYFFKKIPGGHFVDFLFPAKSTMLSSVGELAIEGAMGNLDPEQYKIVTSEDFIEYEAALVPKKEE